MNDNQRTFITGGLIGIMLYAMIANLLKAIKNTVKFIRTL
jgi:hypothetical protein